MDPHARPPLEGGGRDEVVLTYAQDRGVGVKAGQDGILDGRRHGELQLAMTGPPTGQTSLSATVPTRQFRRDYANVVDFARGCGPLG